MYFLRFFALFSLVNNFSMSGFRNLFNTFLFVLLFLFVPVLLCKSQTLKVPPDVKKAYLKGSRSADGRPGLKYWQNSAVYDIEVTVLPPSRAVKGSESITYTNNSPDTLKSIVIRLVQNNHKAGAARFGNSGKDYITDGITIDRFVVNGTEDLWNDKMGQTTSQEVKLKEPLLPGRSLSMAVDWHYSISRQSGREGMIDSTSFFLAYFYPRISVYDDYNGWDKTEFTGGPEFYNDFNSYSLKVNVPAGYLVWATGDLENAGEVLQPAIVQRLNKVPASDSTIVIAGLQEQAAGKVTLKKDVNTWHFESANVSDVAAGISNHFIWEAASVVVDSKTGRRAEMHAAYSEKAAGFREMVQDGRYALNWFSHVMPGIPYPYPKMTAFEGNADMEYPMMINDTSIEGLNGRRITNHEIAHSWFPFFMGTNESRYGFMDEGWATTLELLIGRSYDKTGFADSNYKKGRVGTWSNPDFAYADVPIITPSTELKEAYRPNAYGKPSLAYMALRDLLGEELFKKGLQTYMNRWNGKHPLPWDFFHSFNDVSGKSLNWFWKNWFFSANHIDLAVNSVIRTGTGYTLTVENTGGFAIPFNVLLEYRDGTTAQTHYTPEVWRLDEKKAVIAIKTPKEIRSLKIDGDLFLDADTSNNIRIVK